MKSIKMFALAALAVLATACSDDDKMTYNTEGGVTVEMKEATVEVMENQGIFTVPMVVNGARNGYVTVTVECTETGNDPAIANRHYYLTTDRINISADDNTAEVELRTVDFRGLNPDRTFNVTIVKVEGATVGARATTTVQINDKGSSPLYADLAGNYIMSYMSPNEAGTELSTENVNDVTISVGIPDENGGGPVLVQGIDGWLNMELYYQYDPEENYGELVLPYGSIAMQPASPYDCIAWVDANGKAEGELVGKWNSSYTGIQFGDSNTTIILGVYQSFPDQYLGAYWIISGFSLYRVD